MAKICRCRSCIESDMVRARATVRVRIGGRVRDQTVHTSRARNTKPLEITELTPRQILPRVGNDISAKDHNCQQFKGSGRDGPYRWGYRCSGGVEQMITIILEDMVSKEPPTASPILLANSTCLRFGLGLM